MKIEVLEKVTVETDGRKSRFTQVHVKVGSRKVIVAVPSKVANDDKKLMEVLEFSIGGGGAKKAQEDHERLRALSLDLQGKKEK